VLGAVPGADNEGGMGELGTADGATAGTGEAGALCGAGRTTVPVAVWAAAATSFRLHALRQTASPAARTMVTRFPWLPMG
jgi:hypothetical protein